MWGYTLAGISEDERSIRRTHEKEISSMSEPTVPPPPPPAAPPPAAPSGGSGNKTLMLVLSYCGLLSLIPLLTEKDDTEVQWHAKHGLVQFFFFVILWVVLGIVTSTGIGCIFVVVYPILGLVWLIVTILSIVKATKGQRFKIPGVSDFADKF
jgi:uncharacterized membrane protein